ncbi:MAG: GIY-YIG nuclease family protein [Anaerolineales bacterium]
MTECYCYIIECGDGTLYTGWTTDPERRIKEHRAGHGARYTAYRKPLRLVYVEPQPDRSAAMRREIQIKRYSTQKKRSLIEGWSSPDTDKSKQRGNS